MTNGYFKACFGHYKGRRKYSFLNRKIWRFYLEVISGKLICKIFQRYVAMLFYLMVILNLENNEITKSHTTSGDILQAKTLTTNVRKYRLSYQHRYKERALTQFAILCRWLLETCNIVLLAFDRLTLDPRKHQILKGYQQ